MCASSRSSTHCAERGSECFTQAPARVSSSMRIPPKDNLTTAPTAPVVTGRPAKTGGATFGHVLADVGARQTPRATSSTVGGRTRPSAPHSPPTVADDDDSDEDQKAVENIQAGV